MKNVINLLPFGDVDFSRGFLANFRQNFRQFGGKTAKIVSIKVISLAQRHLLPRFLS